MIGRLQQRARGRIHGVPLHHHFVIGNVKKTKTMTREDLGESAQVHALNLAPKELLEGNSEGGFIGFLALVEDPVDDLVPALRKKTRHGVVVVLAHHGVIDPFLGRRARGRGRSRRRGQGSVHKADGGLEDGVKTFGEGLAFYGETLDGGDAGTKRRLGVGYAAVDAFCDLLVATKTSSRMRTATVRPCDVTTRKDIDLLIHGLQADGALAEGDVAEVAEDGVKTFDAVLQDVVGEHVVKDLLKVKPAVLL